MSTKSFWQIHNLAQGLQQVVDKAIKERTGVGFAQYKVLEAVGYKGIAKQNELAKMLHQTEAGVSRQVKILYQKGLLVYTSAQKKGSGSDVALTRIGEEVVRLAYQVVDGYSSSIDSVVNPENLEATHKSLRDMDDFLREEIQGEAS